MEYIDLDTSPINESCVQVSTKTEYLSDMRKEALRMVELLNNKFPNITGDFSIVWYPHDFGKYAQIRYSFDDDEEGWRSSNFVESNFPETWQDTEVCNFV